MVTRRVPVHMGDHGSGLSSDLPALERLVGDDLVVQQVAMGEAKGLKLSGFADEFHADRQLRIDPFNAIRPDRAVIAIAQISVMRDGIEDPAGLSLNH